MKSHSERVKNKNTRDLCGKPLFYYILETLEKCHNISKIVVDTDSDMIKEKLSTDFKNVVILNRLSSLCGDLIPMNAIIAHDLKYVEGDYFLQTHATNPFLHQQTIDDAIRFFLSKPKYDSLFSVNKIQKRYYDLNAKPINHDLKIMLRSQDFTPLYEENSCIFLFSRKSFELENNRIGRVPYMFQINKEESIDIDDEFDFELASCLIQKRLCQK